MPRRRRPTASTATQQRFYDALADDFNTPAARAVLFEWIAEANRRVDAGERVGVGGLREMLRVLGLENLLESEDGTARGARAGRAARAGAAPSATSPGPTRCATSSPRWAGWCATRPKVRKLVPRDK